ncbi:TetR/AcrR family transcriptional regulator [Pseudonocardia sp. ICBG1293]|uniref:TetR/AcrR family transcriptional regulator n=1 Tax=Pseudonocardia sp. ICBG1293 TaxID=2844382 RepID=UPI001CC94941|nr:TetR/AcrR family transcriptional regulator [Pseudonocardia sp. ICBG1293]
MRTKSSTTGQKRPSAIEEARRSQIVDCAVEVVAELGYARASLSRIAERADVSKGVISYHFASRDDLFDLLVEQVYERITEFVVPQLEATTTVTDRLRARFSSIAAYLRAHPAQMVALTEVLTTARDAHGRPRYGDAFNEPYYQALEETFRTGQESGELRDFDVRVMAVTVQAAIESMVAYSDGHPDHDIAAHAEQLAELFVRAVRADRRGES